MKKVNILLGILVLILCFAGCGKKEEPVPEVTPEPVYNEEIVIKDSEGKDIVDITTLSKDEFVALSWEQVRDFTEVCLPNYRTTYKIAADYEMQESDWVRIKEMMFWQLFGQIYEEYVQMGEVYDDVEIEIEEFGTDWIYVTPTEEYLRSLTQEEFGEYLNNFYAYHNMEIKETDPETGVETVFDFKPVMTSVSIEEFEEIREQFILEMKDLIEYGSQEQE